MPLDEAAVDLPARADAKVQFAGHAVIDFTACSSKREQEKKAKLLAAKAEDRGCLHAPPV